MPAQFIHGETYALQGSHGKPSIAEVLAEAVRKAGYHPHIPEAQAPVLLHGLPPQEILPLVKDRVTRARDRRGRRLPPTFASLLGVVVSLPYSPQQVDADFHLTIEANWVFNQSVDFLQAECGPVVSAILHRDEAFLHAHNYILADFDGETQALSIETVWAPARAAGVVRRAGGTHAMQNAAFRIEATGFQDRFHTAVGEPAGFERAGPRRRRLPRADHLAQRAADEKDALIAAEVARRAEAINATIHREAEERVAAALVAAEARAAAAAATAADAAAFRRRIDANARGVAEELLRMRDENAQLRARLELLEPGEVNGPRHE